MITTLLAIITPLGKIMFTIGLGITAVNCRAMDKELKELKAKK